MKRLEEIEADMNRPRYVVYVDAAQSFVDEMNRVVQDRRWLCEKIREAADLLENAADAADERSWWDRREALLAALDEVTR